MIQFCDDTTCSFQLTDKEGVAAFETADQKVYDIHVLKAPEGYEADTNVYKTQDVFSDVSIYLKRPSNIPGLPARRASRTRRAL